MATIDDMQNKQWWGTVEIPENSSFLLHNKSFILAVEHKANEWCIHTKREKVLDIDTYDALKKEMGEFSVVNCGAISRYIISGHTNSLDIKPSLADRPIVCRPKLPITLLPNASVVIYLSMPIWLSIGVLGKEITLLKEVATEQLSDTWFGATTREGELCYASQTTGRLELDTLPFRALRAITPVLIKNKADNNLIFERIALPAPSLSLYATPSGQLWTQDVSLIREDDDDLARIKLGKPQPESVLVNGPRVELHHGQLTRAFSAIFG